MQPDETQPLLTLRKQVAAAVDLVAREAEYAYPLSDEDFRRYVEMAADAAIGVVLAAVAARIEALPTMGQHGTTGVLVGKCDVLRVVRGSAA